MQTIYEKISGDLIPTLPRIVDTFPSGLIRVNQVYIGRSDLNSTHRQLLQVGNMLPSGDNFPSVEPLRIFPEVAETKRVDGLTEYSVTAYGRANTLGQTSLPIKIGTEYDGYAVRFPRIRMSIPTSSLSLPDVPTFSPDFIFSNGYNIKKLPLGSFQFYYRAGPALIFTGIFPYDSIQAFVKRSTNNERESENIFEFFWATNIKLESSTFENYGQFDELLLNYTSDLTGDSLVSGPADQIYILDKNGSTLTNLGNLFSW
jgi:hypothetical protein